jgi:hypothetical protein
VSLLVEMWSTDNQVPVRTRWPCCRKYRSLDEPMRARVTRIVNDPKTGIRREFTSTEYVINPIDIEQRNLDRKNCKRLSASIFLIIMGILAALTR